MGRFLLIIPILVFIPVFVFTAFSENTSDQIVLYYLKNKGEKDIRYDFSPGEKIYADFTFFPKEKESKVEFRWINPLNKKEQIYTEVVKSPVPNDRLTVICWLYLPLSFIEKATGSKYFGRWLLEVWVNDRLAATRMFDVGN